VEGGAIRFPAATIPPKSSFKVSNLGVRYRF
jgi:hypothetical protein